MEFADTLADTEVALKPMLTTAQESVNSNLSTIRTVILKVLSDPKIFSGFDQIKAALHPTLVSMPEGEPLLKTLDLFSYGSYRDYVGANSGVYLSLSEGQVNKLRQLTILTLVEKSCLGVVSNKGHEGVIPYHNLAVELGFMEESQSSLLDENVLRQVEDAVLSCIYARVVSGQLCQKTKSLVVSSRKGPPCRARDVPLSEVSAMLQTLTAFHKLRLERAQASQEKSQEVVQSQLDTNRRYLRSIQDRKKKAESNNTSMGGPSSSGSAAAAAAAAAGPMRMSGSNWPDTGPQERRSSGTARRHSKRSRGGGSGFGDQFSRF